jgi:hypothetical protein
VGYFCNLASGDMFRFVSIKIENFWRRRKGVKKYPNRIQLTAEK